MSGGTGGSGPRAVLAGGCAAIFLSGCLGTGTRRIDAACREMRSTVVYEMLRDNPTIRLVDLRRPSEVSTEEGRLANAKEIPLERLPTRLKELGQATRGTIVVFGRVGDEGRKGCQFLVSSGYEYVIFVSDGAEGWFRNGLPGAPRAVPPTDGDER